MIGRTLAHYLVLAEIGRGGMGVVYRARDERLGREVALKVLRPEFVADPERRRRFVQEARAAAALEHPHIAAVYDVGEADGSAFIAMPLLRGEPLRDLLARGRLPTTRAVTLALEIADGLSAAHERGVVHRDLTPGNVIVGDDGHARVIDFGLAKLLDSATDAETLQRTAAGVMLGTAGYMSPEQVRGETADHRADVFMLGILLHEMLSGDTPFRRSSGLDTLNAIVREEPRPLAPATDAETGGHLSRIVHKCLAKDPANRYQTMKDLVVDLRDVRRRLESGLGATGAAGATAPTRRRGALWAIAAALLVTVAGGYGYWRSSRPATGASGAAERIAVLVFQNLGAAEDDYFAAGVTEEITSRLSGVRQLAVISRNSVLRFTGSTASGQEIGRELGVDYILQGTVRWQPAKDGPGQVRITPQLIRVADDTQVWSETYERRFDEIFAIQSEIAGRVTRQLGTAVLTMAIGAAPKPTENLEAYKEYLRGTYLFYHPRSRQHHLDALQHFERAVSLDPQFAAAHGAVAIAAAWQFFYEEPLPSWEARAEAAIARALSLDANLSDAYLARANLMWTQPRGFPHERALAEYRRAIALNPSSAEARVALGRIYQHIGLEEEALAELEEAQSLDPDNGEARFRIVVSYQWNHQHAETLAALDRFGMKDPWTRVTSLSYLGRDDEAWALASTLVSPDWQPDPANMALPSHFYVVLLAKRGQRDRVRAVLPKLEHLARNTSGLSHLHHVQYTVAQTHALIGQPREAMAWLRKAAAEGFPCYPFMAKDPNLASLAGDREFIAFMREMQAQWERFRAAARQQ